MTSTQTHVTSSRATLAPAATIPSPVGMITVPDAIDSSAGELTDAELETVVGGLARSYVVPVAPLSRRPI